MGQAWPFNMAAALTTKKWAKAVSMTSTCTYWWSCVSEMSFKSTSGMIDCNHVWRTSTHTNLASGLPVRQISSGSTRISVSSFPWHEDRLTSMWMTSFGLFFSGRLVCETSSRSRNVPIVSELVRHVSSVTTHDELLVTEMTYCSDLQLSLRSLDEVGARAAIMTSLSRVNWAGSERTTGRWTPSSRTNTGCCMGSVLGEIKLSPTRQVHYKSCLLLSFLSLNLSQ